MLEKIFWDFYKNSDISLTVEQQEEIKRVMREYAVAAIHDSKVAEEAMGNV